MCEEGSKIDEREDKENINVGRSDDSETVTTSTSATVQNDYDSDLSIAANDAVDNSKQTTKSAEEKTLEEIKEISQPGEEHIDPTDNVFIEDGVNLHG